MLLICAYYVCHNIFSDCVFTTISNIIYNYIDLCWFHVFFAFFPMLSRVTWCYDISIVSSLNCGCMMFWWMCLMVLWCFVWHSIQDGVQVLITHNLRIGVLDIPPPILSRALAGKRHWATQGTQGCLVNFFCRPRRHSEDASENLQTYKRCGRRNMLDQGHDMVWRTERESFAFGMDCNIF